MNEDITKTVLSILLIVGAVFFGVIIGTGATNGIWENDMIKRGYAEYVMNPSDGSTKWQWKEEKH